MRHSNSDSLHHSDAALDVRSQALEAAARARRRKEYQAHKQAGEHLHQKIELDEANLQSIDRRLHEKRVPPLQEELLVRLVKGACYVAFALLFFITAVGLIHSALRAVWYAASPGVLLLFAMGFGLAPVAAFHAFVRHFSKTDEGGRPLLSRAFFLALLLIVFANITAWALVDVAINAALPQELSGDLSPESAEQLSAALAERTAIGRILGAIAIDIVGAMCGSYGLSLIFVPILGVSNLALWLLYRRRTLVENHLSVLRQKRSDWEAANRSLHQIIVVRNGKDNTHGSLA